MGAFFKQFCLTTLYVWGWYVIGLFKTSFDMKGAVDWLAFAANAHFKIGFSLALVLLFICIVYFALIGVNELWKKIKNGRSK